MEALTLLTFLIVVALLIIVLSNNAGLNSKIGNLIREVNFLKYEIQKRDQPGATLKPETTQEKKAPEPVKSMEMPANAPIPKTVVEEKKTVTAEPIKPEPAITRQPSILPQTGPAWTPKPKKPKKDTDFEKFIGENLISKIGIIILVLGVGFFVKYAIDQNWINEYGRTAIGLLIGAALVGVAHYIRKSYKTFSSLLTGGGIAVFYLTITIAFHEYQIFSQTAAFVLLVIVTAFSVFLSLAYDKRELAIFSLIGGFGAPFMISTGEGNYIVLFTYMLILCAGLITLAYFKRWHILNLLAFIFTVVIYSSWLGNALWNNNHVPYAGALIFASLFYLVFFLVNALNNLKEQKSFNGIEISMILSNNLFYFLSGLAILHSYQGGVYKGLFTVLIGLYNFGWVVFLYKKKQVDKNFIFLLIGLVMSFISIAVPIQLNGHSITLFWSAEFVILLWLWQKSGIKLLKIGHLVVLVLAIISLIMDWNNLYGNYQTFMGIVFNQAFVTGLVMFTGLVLSYQFLRKETEEMFIPFFFSVKGYRLAVVMLLFIMAYLVPFLELSYQIDMLYQEWAFKQVVYGVYNFAYLFLVLLLIKRFGWQDAFKWFFGTALAGLFIYLVFYHPMVLQVRDAYFWGHTVNLENFLFHYLVYPFLAGIIILTLNGKDLVFSKSNFWSKAFLWYLTFFVVFVLSAELDNILLLGFKTTDDSIYAILRISHKVGYPILWTIAAFVLIIWGIRKKIKDYRIIALSLLGLILVKLFLIDVWSMNKGGRIAAFIFLGIVLLIISFLYQKLKRLLSPDESNNPTQENA